MTAKKGFLSDELWNEPCEVGVIEGPDAYRVVWNLYQDDIFNKLPYIGLSGREQLFYVNRFDEYGAFGFLRPTEGEKKMERFLVRAQDTNGHQPRARDDDIVCTLCEKCLIK